MPKIVTVIGTRPDAIKLSPVVNLFKNDTAFETFLVATAQHRELLDQVLRLFSLSVDIDLDIMRTEQDLFHISTTALMGFKSVYRELSPDLVIVQGDTTSTFIAALSAFYENIPVAHIEAGLRTFERYSPFPEEMNRVLTDDLSTILFPPTKRTKENLLNEGRREHLHLTGNTGIDAVLSAVHHIEREKIPTSRERFILVTCHRRESFGEPIKEICEALKDIITSIRDIEIVYPVHPNPNISLPVKEILGGVKRINLIDPPGYLEFVKLMKDSCIVLTDSGGLQEEAPSLGKPVLVMRDVTERIEGIEKGVAILVGRDRKKIVDTVSQLLEDSLFYNSMKGRKNPYGDGRASERIQSYIRKYFNLPYQEISEFQG
ncbi:UDP-N-acetylglucosamine 2-epimerase (non-hydrolyzing) [candidate division WOR-3 bacterium]|nr:UDP-N-acetylglucosamine 2-epimerase (non-hydrolyzing) [candidate division WOR-3 bacterium]